VGGWGRYNGVEVIIKTTIIIVASLAFTAVGAYAYVYELDRSFPTPGPNPRGCWGGGGFPLYIVQDGAAPIVYRVSQSGQVLSSFPCPGGPGAWGIALYKYNYFYITNHETSWFYQTTTGSLISSFLGPLPNPADLCNRFYDYLYVAYPHQNLIGLINPTTGSLLSTLAGPGTEPTACGPNSGAWFIADAGTHAVYEYGVPVVTGIGAPTGFDSLEIGRGPWTEEFYVVDDATDRVLVYSNVTAVEPASLGRVKALYR